MTTKLTVSTKGHLIDPYCSYDKTGTIVEFDGNIYDCTLNQTDISNSENKNKFYIMQLIKSGPEYIIYIRYGRVGATGRIVHDKFTELITAIDFFESQFKKKTGNSWYARHNFVKKDKKYYLADIEYAEISSESDTQDSQNDDIDDIVELDNRIMNFLKLISNSTYMKNTLIQLEIDIDKMPLGKISQKQIDNAYEIINQINQNLDNDDKLSKLSSEFYTLIPIACGMKKPPIINSKKLIGKNIHLINELSQMVYGTKAVIKLEKNSTNFINFYNDLHTEIIPLDKNDDMYIILEKYLKNSKASTHQFNFDILEIFQIDREGERKNYEKYCKKIDNKILLFHGTRISNMIGILKNGLVCDPSKLGINVNITGKMFGLGVYFANSVSKSIQYCAYDSSENIACVFVCEVALGNMLKKSQSDSNLTATTLPKIYHSTWGVDNSSYTNYDEYDDNTKIPKGKLQKISKNKNASLLYDEFIVYHEGQINLRYIIKLKVKN